jgi:hypothetical protein
MRIFRFLQYACSTVAVMVAAGSTAACAAPGYPELANLVSPGGTYLVRLSGRVTRAAFLEHRVRIEVYKNGALHSPARLIFAAGLFDTAFDERFRNPEWVGLNILRFPAEVSSSALEPDTLIVRNLSPQVFRSIRVETGKDMFILLDLAAGAGVTVRMTADVKPTWFDVVVDPGKSETLLRGHGTFPVASEPRAPRRFTVDVSDNGARVAEQ